MNKELIKKHLERWEGLQVASIQNYAETGKISGFLYLAIEKMLDEHAKEAYNQAIRDAAENAELRIKIRFECTNEELERGFGNGLHAIIVNKESILNLLK